MQKILCVFRAACYSPGMIERDEAILRAVAERLESTGYTVNLIHEEDLTPSTPIPDIVLHMVRSSRALKILEEWQEEGCRVINSVEGVRSVERAALARYCAAEGIPTPKTWIINTDAGHCALTTQTTNGDTEDITFPCWIKRAGNCAQEPDDVCLVSNEETYRKRIARFHGRGINKVVVMEHLEGVCMKFYAVRGSGFSYHLPAEELGYDKFSNTTPAIKSNKTTRGNVHDFDFPFSIPQVPLEVYGGDAIICADGVIRLIDLNDWPSFSACRNEAADAIVRLVKCES